MYSNIEQLGICLVKLGHKEKDVRCRFFIVPSDGQVPLGMLDIEVLGILKNSEKILMVKSW